jgi:hypothetical protein
MPERTNFEVINRGQVTPRRIHALLRLVPRRRRPSREELLTLLQPPELGANSDAAVAVFAAAVRCSLIVHDTVQDLVTLHPEIPRARTETVEGFRSLMQGRLCGVHDPDMDNFLLNQVVAWYAVQQPNVYRLKKADLATQFNLELYPQEPDAGAETGRALNDTKLNAWYTWVAFLGWGFVHGDVLWPVAHARLLPKLTALRGRTLTFSGFMDHVAAACPEMDGGSLFEQCWAASRPGQSRGQQLSFMLSTALGTLHGLKKVVLERSADALDRWQIYPSSSYPFHDVTHIAIAEQ